MDTFNFLPDVLVEPVVKIVGIFVGDGWHLTLGALFMIIVIFLPGGIIEGITKLKNKIKNLDKSPMTSKSLQTQES